nr:reverse transcriptase domain-containing protein [Tanacetum cinerariifolium]
MSEKTPVRIQRWRTPKVKVKKAKPTDEDDLTMTWMCEEVDSFTPQIYNFKSSRAARVWFDELPPESIDSYKDLKAAFLAYFMQQKKYVKDPVKIHNINLKRTERPSRTSWNGQALPSYEEKPSPLAKRKVIHHEEHMTSQSGTLQRRGLTFEVNQGKERGLAGLPPYKNTKRNSRCRGKKVPAKVTQSFERVREITFPSLATSNGTEGPLVIEAEISEHMIHRMYVDGGSSTKVLYEHCFNWLWPEVKNQMVLATTSLTDFSGETIWPLGQLRLFVTIGDADHSTRAWMNFMIIRSLSPYDGIIGRHGIKEIQAVPSTSHEMLKFPADRGIVTICSTILIPVECATVITLSKEMPKEAGVHHENFKVALHSNFPDQEMAIGGALSAKGRTELCSLLKENLDIFAWQPSDMTGVPRSVAEHRLNIREGYSPV